MNTEQFNQYKTLHAKHPDCVLLFRRGLRYFAFNNHAKLLAEVCETETIKDGRIITASIAEFELKTALRAMNYKGYRVAVCEPLIKPNN